MSVEDVIEIIENSIDGFQSKMPEIQRAVFARLELIAKELETDNAGNVKNSVANMKLLNRLKSAMNEAILNKQYLKQSADFIKSFDAVSEAQNQMFSKMADKFKPLPLLSEIRKQSIDTTLDYLTGAGIDANLANPIKEILRKNITSGSSFNQLMKQLRNDILSNETGLGRLERYTQQITTDALNQFSAEYTLTISNDLGFEWFIYTGSNKRTTRPWCEHMKKKKYIHVCEFQAVLTKDIDGVKIGSEEIPVNPKSGLARGLITDTTPKNLQVLRGGHNCGHQLSPTSEALIPKDIRDKVYASAEYKAWKEANRMPTNPIKQEQDSSGNLNIDIAGFNALKDLIGKSATKVRKNNVAKIKKLNGMEEIYTFKGKGVYKPDDRKISEDELLAAKKAVEAGIEMIFSSPSEFSKVGGKTPPNFDTYIVGKNYKLYPADIKSNFTGTSNSIQQSIVASKNQSPTVIIDLRSKVKLKDLVEGINAGFIDNSEAKRVIVLYKRMSAQYTRNQAINYRELERLIANDFK